jgi:hypothetical protein
MILDGLQPGERVVTEGVQKLREGAAVQPTTTPPGEPTAGTKPTKE